MKLQPEPKVVHRPITVQQPPPIAQGPKLGCDGKSPQREDKG